jgi:PIN domain nuclease of toxin-antitoxin system
VEQLSKERYLMPAVAVDTHAIVWYLSADAQLSARAPAVLDAATEAGEFIHVPSICLVELTYLVEKGRLQVVADALETVSRREVPDLPDRIVSATAVALGVPLISRDGKIRSSQVQTIW